VVSYLCFYTTAIDRHLSFQPLLTPQVPAILDAVFESTLAMINQDFTEYPEHRVGFYKLLRAIDLSCFEGERPRFLMLVHRALNLRPSFTCSSTATIQDADGQYHLGHQTHDARYSRYRIESYVSSIHIGQRTSELIRHPYL
jgi:hypothetical protein